jgi:hypothetical protein
MQSGIRFSLNEKLESYNQGCTEKNGGKIMSKGPCAHAPPPPPPSSLITYGEGAFKEEIQYLKIIYFTYVESISSGNVSKELTVPANKHR